MEHLGARVTIKAKDMAYREMRLRVDPSGTATAQYPISLLMEWDEARCKLNPNARLSYAQKLLT